MNTVPIESVVKIPLSQILPNPNNPRGPVPPEVAQAMVESLKAVGQKTEIRVRPLAEAEKLQNPGFEYLLIGGHVRLAGAKLAGWEALRAVVVEGTTPEEEELDALMDNCWFPMNWVRQDLALARRHNVYKVPQRQIARERGISPAMVNRAVTVAGVLTPGAIELIEQTLNQNPTEEGQGVSPGNTPGAKYEVNRKVVLALAGLEDPQKVEEALKTVIREKMTEAKVRQMVAASKAGITTPPTSPNQTPVALAEAPSEHPKVLPQIAASPHAKASGDRSAQGAGSPMESAHPKLGHRLMASAQGLLKAVGLGKGKAPNKSRKAGFGKGAGGQPQVGQPSAKAGAAFAMGQPIQAVGHWLLQQLGSAIRASLKRAVMGVIVLVLLWAGFKTLVWVILGRHYKGTFIGSVPLKAPSNPVSVALNPGHPEPPMGVESTQPQPGHQPMDSPDAKAGGTPARWAKQSKFVLDFVGNLYGISYKNLVRPQIYTLKLTNKNYTTVFIAEFFPDSKIQEIKDKKLVMSFKPDGPVKFLKHDNVLDEDEYSLAGILTTQSDLNKEGELVARSKVTLRVGVMADAGGGFSVSNVEVKESVSMSAQKAQGEDPVGNFLGNTAKDAGNAAVSGANKAVSQTTDDAVNQVLKKFSPF